MVLQHTQQRCSSGHGSPSLTKGTILSPWHHGQIHVTDRSVDSHQDAATA